MPNPLTPYDGIETPIRVNFHQTTTQLLLSLCEKLIVNKLIFLVRQIHDFLISFYYNY